MRAISLKSIFFVLLICIAAVCQLRAQSSKPGCPVRVEVMDVATGRYVKGAKVTAEDVITDETFSSVINAGIPYFRRLAGKVYTYTATAPGYKKTVDSFVSLYCGDRFEGQDAVIHSVYVWKGSPRETVQTAYEKFTPPPYKGRYGVLAPVPSPDNDPSPKGRIVYTIGPMVDSPKPAVEAARPGTETKIAGPPKGEISAADSAVAPSAPPEPAQTKPRDRRLDMIAGGVLNGKATVLPKPSYTKAAIAAKAKGAVNVKVFIDEEGNVTGAEALSGHPLLRPAAVEAARRAKFRPTLLSGQPIKIWGVVVYNFVP